MGKRIWSSFLEPFCGNMVEIGTDNDKSYLKAIWFPES
jgi:hypothetical protein